MFKTILFPIYQSEEALETSNKAIEFALSQKSRMVILSVIQHQGEQIPNKDSMASLLQLTLEKVQKAGLTCDLIEKEGNPAFVICDMADEMKVDVIIMGTRGIDLNGGQEGIAARVIQLAPCPVLVVP